MFDVVDFLVFVDIVFGLVEDRDGDNDVLLCMLY